MDSTEIVIAQLFLPITASISESADNPIYCAPLLMDWQTESVNWAVLGDSISSEMVDPDRIDFPVTTQGTQACYLNITDFVKPFRNSGTNYGLKLFATDEQLSISIQNEDPELTLKIISEPN